MPPYRTIPSNEEPKKLGKNIKRGELIPPINLDKETIDWNSAERR